MFEVARRLVTRGWKITWYTFKTWEGEANLELHGIRYVGLPGYVPLYTASGRRSAREALAFGRAVWSRHSDIRKADVVWCGQWPYFHLLPLLFRSRASCLIDWWEVWGRHWFEYAGPVVGCAGLLGERAMARFCSKHGKIITISPCSSRDLVAIGANPHSVYMFPNGIDIGKIDQVPFSGDQIDIVYVGRLKNHKNVDHIVRVLHLLRSNYGLLLRADIIGSGPEEGALRNLVVALGVESQIRFLGALNDDQKYAHMKSAAIFVHPSTKESGGSLTLLEAQACGTPVMIYNADQGIDRSFVSEGKTGWIVDPVAPEALAACIAGIFDEGKFKHRSMEDDCRKAAAVYDWGVIADSYHKLFSEE